MAAENTSSEKVFRALGDHTRRKIISILGKYPGITVSEVCSEFSTSRFAVMKHLNLLEEAGLIRREKNGTQKLLFLQGSHLKETVNAWLEGLP